MVALGVHGGSGGTWWLWGYMVALGVHGGSGGTWWLWVALGVHGGSGGTCVVLRPLVDAHVNNVLVLGPMMCID